MQIVPGRTLREILNEKGAWTFERADRVLRDVAGALAHAHERGIVHRDVKPENIFIDETSGRAMLSDFGVARSIESDSQLTATGTAIGTPSYMSPEQIDGTELDGRSDLYSLGLVGWEMLTGRRPWEGESLYSVIYKQKREELQPIEELRPDTPNRLIYLVEGAMQKSPADRWSGAAEFVERASTIAPEGGWSRWQAERRKKRRALVYSAARERGDSVLSAALETVRFRPDQLQPRPDVASVSGARPGAGVVPASQNASTTVPGRRTAAPEPRRRSLASVLVVTAIVIAAIGASARLIRGRAQPLRADQGPTTFADDGGVEVPVARLPLPNAPSAAPTSPSKAQPLDSANSTASRGRVDSSSSGANRAVALQPSVPRAPGAGSSTGDVAAAGRTQPPPVVLVPVVPALTLPSAGRTAPATAGTDSDRSLAPAPNTGSVSFPQERAVVAAGGRHSCSLDDAGHAKCWGANDEGQLGDASHDDHTGPVIVAGDLAFSQLSAGSSHTCGITRDGDAYCWGNNERGQLGDATTLQRDTPVRVGASGPFKTVRAGFSHSCALSRAGEVSCWGSNMYGQLGTGGGLTSARPADVPGSLRFGAMAVGWNHTCAITTTGELYCWGSNSAGQIGDGTRDDRRTPTRAAGNTRFVSVAAGNQHTCAVTTTGELYCWGRNNYGQLGTGAGDRSQPTRVEAASSDFSTVTAGAVHSCARSTAGQVFCWGRNTFGQLGDGTTTDRPAPVRVVGIPAVAVVQASGAHTCAATSSGESYCWGYNVEGQLGDGTRNHRSRPIRVETQAR